MKQTLKYKEYFKIRTYHSDFLRRATPSSILSYMQEVATNHAESLGLGYHESNSAGYFWVLRSAKYEFTRSPMLKDELEVQTWPSGVDGLRALRRFDFFIDNDKIGQGYNYWLMIDTKTLKPVLSNYYLQQISNLSISEEDFFKLPKVPIEKDMTFVYDTTMQNSDLDWNQHVNNVRYGEMIFNTIPMTLLLNKSIQSLHVDYLKECKHSDCISMFMKMFDHKIVIEGRMDTTPMFRSEVIFN